MKEQGKRAGRPTVGMLSKTHLTVKLSGADELLDEFKAQVDVVIERSQFTISELVRQVFLWAVEDNVLDKRFRSLIDDGSGTSVPQLAKKKLAERNKKAK